MTVTAPPSPRGTSNGNVKGNTEDRRRRRAWMMLVWASDVAGYVRCYRCGKLLYNEDDMPLIEEDGAERLTIDRIVPGCFGGTYARNNIRPACGGCNSSTGAPLAAVKKRKRK